MLISNMLDIPKIGPDFRIFFIFFAVLVSRPPSLASTIFAYFFSHGLGILSLAASAKRSFARSAACNAAKGSW